MIRTVYRRIARLPERHPLRRVGSVSRRFRWARRVTDRLLRGDAVDFAADGKAYFAELLRCAAAAAPARRAVPRRVLLVNNGLSAGGAERQVVNTLLGLEEQALESVGFLGEYLYDTPDRSFFVPELERAGIAFARVGPRRHRGKSRVEPRLAGLLARLPPDLELDILDLVAEFEARRPEIVHAWQDSTSIKCGIAGVIAGVPRILLSSHNVNPSNFAYHQPYMRPAYQALADLPAILFSNNSEAGAADYCDWLGTPRERFRVLYYGVALDGLRPDPEGARRLRQREGIPPAAALIGSMFRFAPEKRPLLWLEAAARLRQQRPQAHFLLAGHGPLEAEMAAFVAATPCPDAFHIVPPTQDIAAALSAMDAFLLTSRFEGTPNVLLEAQWLGVPVVATEAGGVREAIAPGESGIVCADDSPHTAAAHLCRIIDDPDWKTRARTAGPRFVRDRFAPQRMIADTMALYGLTGAEPARAARP